MDQVIIDQKLESLRRCVRRLHERCPDTPELLSEDLDAQDIVSLNLTRAIQLCVDIAAHWLADQDNLGAPQTMGETFSLLAQGDKIPKSWLTVLEARSVFAISSSIIMKR